MSAQRPDRRCERLAARQHGVLTRGQALDAGMAPRTIARRVSGGRWERLHRGVYRPVGVPGTWSSALMAAILWSAPDGVVSHRAAARLYSLDGLSEAPVEISAPTGRTAAGVTVHRVPRHPRVRRRRMNGFPVTVPERTLLDLAAVLPITQAGAALDDALRRRLTTLGKMRRLLDTDGRSGRDGTASMRKLLALRDERDAEVESALESRLLRLLRDAGLPGPVIQHEVRVGGKLLARLDFAYPDLRLGIEVHGYRWHGGREAWQRDIRRENRLKRMGWTVLVFTWDDVAGNPERVLAEISGLVTRSY